MLKLNPGNYLESRVTAYVNLMGLSGIEKTLRAHFGKDGNAEYLQVVGLPVIRDLMGFFAYDVSSAFFKWPGSSTHSGW